MRAVWLLVILAAGAGFWFYTHPESAGTLKARLPLAAPHLKTDRLYKWRNDRNEWQVTDTPPPAGTAYEILDYREDVNVLPVPPQLDRDR